MTHQTTPPQSASSPSDRDTTRSEPRSYDEFRTLLEANPYAVIVHRRGRFLYANRAALDLFGASSYETLAAHGLIDFIHPDDCAQFIRHVILPDDGSKIPSCDVRCVRLDGMEIYIEASGMHVPFGSERAVEIVLRDITKKKQGETMIRQQAAVMDGINRILHAALKYETEEELGNACLQIAQEITQSPLGFIGDVRGEGLEKITLTIPPGMMPEFSKATIHAMPNGGFNMHSLYGNVLSEGKSFFTNDPHRFVEWAQIPPGHPMLDSFLGVPLKHEGRTIGMIGLGNKRGGYTRLELEFIEALAPAIVESFMRKRMEARMQQLFDQTRRDGLIKTDLLNEINHRVKNNLMTILGLILAEKRHMPADQLASTERVWNKFELRISGLLRVHQMLSDSQWTPMNVSELAMQICTGIIENFDMTGQVALAVEPSDVTVSPRQSNNIALVFNELMTNSLKYAFDHTDAPAVAIETQTEGRMVRITFRDNGAGYSTDVLVNGKHNVGLRLVHQLVEDTLDGEVRLRNSGGAVAEIYIRCEEPAKYQTVEQVWA